MLIIMTPCCWQNFHIGLLNQSSNDQFTVLFVFVYLTLPSPVHFPLCTPTSYEFSSHLNELSLCFHGSLIPNEIIPNVSFSFTTLNIALSVKQREVALKGQLPVHADIQNQNEWLCMVMPLNDSKTYFCNITVNQLIGQGRSYVGTEA